MLVVDIGLIDIEFIDIDSLVAGIDLHILSIGMTHLSIQLIEGGLHVHLEVHVIGRYLVGIDSPWLAGFLLRLGFLFLGLIAHLGLAALERGVAHIHLVVVQVNLGFVDFGIIQVHVQVHRAVLGLDLALGALERGVIHLYLLIKQGTGLDIALHLVGLEQRVAVLVDDLHIGGSDVERESHAHVTHADVHARLRTGILGSGIGKLVLNPRDIEGKRQRCHHAHNASRRPLGELAEHIFLFAKHLDCLGFNLQIYKTFVNNK